MTASPWPKILTNEYLFSSGFARKKFPCRSSIALSVAFPDFPPFSRLGSAGGFLIMPGRPCARHRDQVRGVRAPINVGQRYLIISYNGRNFTVIDVDPRFPKANYTWSILSPGTFRSEGPAG
jgi:hypothetical protein